MSRKLVYLLVGLGVFVMCCEDLHAQAVETSPWLAGVCTQSPMCINDGVFQEMFSGRDGGWLVIPVYQWIAWDDGEFGRDNLQYNLRPEVEAAANAGFCVILRLYWKQAGAENMPRWDERFGQEYDPAGQWCIPPEPAHAQFNADALPDFVDWCQDVVEVLGGGDPNLPAVCSHYIVGNEPNQEGEHGGSGCFPADWCGIVFVNCAARMERIASNSKPIVPGVTPGVTGCMADPNAWKEYVTDIVEMAVWLVDIRDWILSLPEEQQELIRGYMGEQRWQDFLHWSLPSRFAIHNNADIDPENSQHASKLYQAFAYGQFEQYIDAIVAGRGTAAGCRYYIDETNPFLHPGVGVDYTETWLIHTLNVIDDWNEDARESEEYGYEPIRCVCYYSYYFTGQDEFNLVDDGGGPNPNHDLYIAARYDFPLLTHRNDAPRPVINFLENGDVGAHSNDAGAPLAVDGDPATYWNGGYPWIGIWALGDGQVRPYGRVVAWQYQAQDGPAESTACAKPDGPEVVIHCRPDARDGEMHVWRRDELGIDEAYGVYLTTNSDYFTEVCEDVTETDMGWYEIEMYPPVPADEEEPPPE